MKNWSSVASRRKRQHRQTGAPTHSRRIAILAWSFLAAGVLAGCATIDPELRARIDGEAASLTPRVDDDEAVEWHARLAIQMRERAGEALAIADEGTLPQYVAIALQRNPSVRRAIRNVEALGQRVPQVASLDDPMLRLLPPTGDLTQTAAGMVDGELGLSQRIPYPGRLDRRGQIAEREVRMALMTLNDVRIRVVSDVARAYYEYYLADASIGITRASEGLLRKMRDVAAGRYRSGTATQQDVLRAEVELYALMNEVITLEQRRATARARLNVLMNRHVEAPLPAPIAFDLEAVEWKLSEAMAQAVESNPQLARLREQIERDLETVRLRKLDYYPDFSIGVGYTIIGSGISPVADGSDSWRLPVGLTLPIWWQRIRAGILEANALTLSSVEQLEGTRNTILFGLQDTLVKVDTQYRRAILFRDLILPRARQTVEVSAAAYQTGNLEFTALIDNWRNWLDFSLAYNRSLAGLEQRFADLQQLIGVRVGRRPEGAHGASETDGTDGRDSR